MTRYGQLSGSFGGEFDSDTTNADQGNPYHFPGKVRKRRMLL